MKKNKLSKKNAKHTVGGEKKNIKQILKGPGAKWNKGDLREIPYPSKIQIREEKL